jgi:hypothetical protein
MNIYRRRCSVAALFASWLVILLTGCSSKAQSPDDTFAELQARVDRDGVDRVADEMLDAGSTNELAGRIAGTLDQNREILRQAPDQLWFQLAARNVPVADELTKFLGKPPAGLMLLARTPTLRQYSAGMARTTSESPKHVLFFRLSNDRTKLFCVTPDNTLLVLNAEDLSEIAHRDPPDIPRSTPHRLKINNPWVGVDPNGELVFVDRTDDLKEHQATQWQRALENVVEPAHAFYSSGILTPDGRHTISQYERFNYLARSIDGGSDRVVFGAERGKGIPQPAFMAALPDGERVVIGDNEGTLSLFNWHTGEQLQLARYLVSGVSA